MHDDPNDCWIKATVPQAHGVNIVACRHDHVHIEFRDENDKVIAEAVLKGMAVDSVVDLLIGAQCRIEEAPGMARVQ